MEKWDMDVIRDVRRDVRGSFAWPFGGCLGCLRPPSRLSSAVSVCPRRATRRRAPPPSVPSVRPPAPFSPHPSVAPRQWDEAAAARWAASRHKDPSHNDPSHKDPSRKHPSHYHPRHNHPSRKYPGL